MFELPFVYMEAGERKEALVKVKVCPRCTAKLLWKPGQDDVEEDLMGQMRSGERENEKEKEDEKRSRKDRDRRSAQDKERRRKREVQENERERSQSQSPRRHSRHHVEESGKSHRHRWD